MKKMIFLILGVTVFGLSSCTQQGCTDPTALNYDPNVDKDDGSCVFLAQNLNVRFNHKLGSQEFAFGAEVQLQSGRKVKFSRAQMYMSGFTFNGHAGQYAVSRPYLLLKADKSDYNLGYLPEGDYTSVQFSAGLDSMANHADPATWPGDHPLSSNNPDHMHWGWDPGYIFYVLEGMVDTTADMSGEPNAPFIFHVGLDTFRVDMAFATPIHSVAQGVTVELNMDWLKLLDGTDMTADVNSRSTHTTNNPALAALMVSNIDEAISLP